MIFLVYGAEMLYKVGGTYRKHLMSQQRKQPQILHVKAALRSIAGASLAAVLLTSCKGYSVTGGPGPLVSEPLRATAAPDLPAAGVKSVAVYPLQNGIGAQLSEEVLQRATENLLQELQANSTLSVLNVIEGRALAPKLDAIDSRPEPMATKARDLGRAMNAQAVLFGTLTKYAPFNGSSSPESPVRFSGANDGDVATSNITRGAPVSSAQTMPGGVGFRLTLIDPNSGKALWTANFDLQERTVAENLFQLRKQIEIAEHRAELARILQLGLRSAVKRLESDRKRR